MMSLETRQGVNKSGFDARAAALNMHKRLCWLSHLQ